MFKHSVRKPFDDVESWVDTLPQGKTIVLYCAWSNEYTSARVARKLIAAGFDDVYALKGGWHNWEVLGFPTQLK